MDCARLAEALSGARGRQEVFRRALAEAALGRGEKVVEGPFVALPIRQGEKTLAVLVLSLEEGQTLPEALPAFSSWP